MPSGKKHIPTEQVRKMVQSMVGCGITLEQIGKIIGCERDTLMRHYRDELDTGVARANTLVAQNLFSIATSKGQGSVAAAIFWMKTRARWRETDRLELTGPDGRPIEVEERKMLDITALSWEQRDQLKQILLTVDKEEDE